MFPETATVEERKYNGAGDALFYNFVHCVLVVDSLTAQAQIMNTVPPLYGWFNNFTIGAAGIKPVARRAIATQTHEPVAGACFQV